MDYFFRLPQEVLLFECLVAFIIYGLTVCLLVLIILGAEKTTYLIVREVKKIGSRCIGAGVPVSDYRSLRDALIKSCF